MSCSAFKAPVTRRDAIRVTAAALVSPALPAFAKKSKMKDAMVQADAVTKQQVAATTGLAAGSAGKGLRGTASSSFDSSTVHGMGRRMRTHRAYVTCAQTTVHECNSCTHAFNREPE